MGKTPYSVYRLKVGEAMELFRKGLSSDPGFADRPIAFYYADQFSRPLASPPPSGARPTNRQTTCERPTITNRQTPGEHPIPGERPAPVEHPTPCERTTEESERVRRAP